MKEKNIILYYVTGTFLLMGLVCISFLIFSQYGYMKQGTTGGIIAIAVGGLSSAIFGAIVSKKSGKISSYKMLAKDFFNVKQPLRYYIVVLCFLIISFGASIFRGEFRNDIVWYSFFNRVT